jgi:zeaxanthin glucosyltransferase
MSNIVFCVPPMTGPINAGMGLARRLASQGHNVSYMGIADCEPTVTTNGFDFTSVFIDKFPKGWLDKFYQNFLPLEFNRDIVEFVEHIISGGDYEIREQFETLNIDLLVISASEFDSIFWALLAHKAKVHSIYLYDVLGGVANHTVPPIHTQSTSSGTFWSSIKNILAWQHYNFMTDLMGLYLALKGISYRSTNRIKKLAEYCDYPLKEIEFLTDMPSPQLSLPQLALFPKEFDFPGVKRKGRFYGDAAIDLNRKQVNFPWHKLIANKPLIYTALSTLPFEPGTDGKRFFQTVIDASLQWPEWNWVISIGKTLSINDFQNIPANVIVVNHAPQLELLKKAILMITHGGPSSIKECIYFGVPMIAFPLWFDQHGNVARIIHHGLGLSGDFKTINIMELRNLILEITTNARYIKNIHKMQKTFQDTEKLGLSMSIIEMFLDKK